MTELEIVLVALLTAIFCSPIIGGAFFIGCKIIIITNNLNSFYKFFLPMTMGTLFAGFVYSVGCMFLTNSPIRYTPTMLTCIFSILLICIIGGKIEKRKRRKITSSGECPSGGGG